MKITKILSDEKEEKKRKRAAKAVDKVIEDNKETFDELAKY